MMKKDTSKQGTFLVVGSNPRDMYIVFRFVLTGVVLI